MPILPVNKCVLITLRKVGLCILFRSLH